MRKLLISSLLILIFLLGCNKDNGNVKDFEKVTIRNNNVQLFSNNKDNANNNDEVVLPAGYNKPNVNIDSMEIINVQDYKELMKEQVGKVVLLNFFGSWCPPCKEETPDFVEVYEKYKDKNNFMIIGMAVDEDQKDAIKFVNDYGITYPVYQADISLLRYFAISPIPATFLYDKEGHFVDSMVGAVSRDILEKIAQFAEEGE